MLAGHRAVQQALTNEVGPWLASQGICRTYMDDRTFVMPTWELAQRRADLWGDFSSRVGLSENSSKTKANAKTKRQKAQLAAQAPDGWVTQELQLLGTVTCTTGRRKHDPKEASRLARAKGRSGSP